MNFKWVGESLAFAAVWVVVFVLSVRTFWRTSNDARRARHYYEGKFWCLFVTVGGALFLPIAVPFSGVSYEIAALFWAIGLFPVALPVGYWVAKCTDVLNDRCR